MSDKLKTFRDVAIGGILFATGWNMIRGLFADNQFERIANGIDLMAGVVVVCALVWLYSLRFQYPESFKKKEKITCSQPVSTESVVEPVTKIATTAEKAVNAELWRDKQ
ncbi:hypothetical protein LU631_07300 [Erwinia tracheiphila]|uniref:Uncharacterized protein n=1 Tax=Erwinia tracheiphila TaxID=65700 RepID=A0A0M2KK26_9GAMM|nr:hypothetical protein [Erwinia tracheiphila]KKF37667.1 hypothetical protein SY86_23330 [Erwinia tracheiphila]UIA89064.1 hypothetical protein LU631_07300 [Erwinia tracheiphila]UIA97447.1 hypothetical protein LU633_05980 [Erwinia tracheiphila]